MTTMATFKMTMTKTATIAMMAMTTILTTKEGDGCNRGNYNGNDDDDKRFLKNVGSMDLWAFGLD